MHVRLYNGMCDDPMIMESKRDRYADLNFNEEAWKAVRQGGERAMVGPHIL